ncbi:transposase [Bradyrhizobium sediminis]|uniref:transposase n=1 Tax=Bradyrhizobium sediminis TaxID=2840469 RepID=UPI00350EE7C0
MVPSIGCKSSWADLPRFRSASTVGARLVLTPRRKQSGETYTNGRISRGGRSLSALQHVDDAEPQLALPM